MISNAITRLRAEFADQPRIVAGDDTGPDSIDLAEVHAALAARAERYGATPAVGDWVWMRADDTMHRIARLEGGYAAFGDVLTTEGDLEGNFYLSDTGEMRYFGGTRRGVPASTLRRTLEVAPTWVWRHHHGTHAVVNIAVDVVVWQSTYQGR
ncbi:MULTISPECIES: hypothetical protein [unclassified Nocardia]|uniref:hypothetical protein n=1 Tax=unclassified Nocardia TaxID=2637762 RepID=UPI00278C32A6|nr:MULTISPECIES: hypothetical protein [unclassified Nocardia]